MALLLQYVAATGEIVGIWQATSASLLEAQMTPLDPVWAYVLTEENLDPGVVQEQYYVPSGVLTPKTTLTIHAAPSTFAADGVDPCEVTVEPFVECTVRIAGVTHALTSGSPIYVLTSASAMAFLIRVEPALTYWAAPVLVHAV